VSVVAVNADGATATSGTATLELPRGEALVHALRSGVA
jgi:hypothetical protein